MGGADDTYSAPSILSTAQSFKIVVVPDPQNEVTSSPAIWEAQMQWIADNYVSQNIQAVIGVGDNVNTPATEYAESLAGWNKIGTTSLPYIVAIGNHDYDNLGTRDATNFNTNLGAATFAGKSWYGGTLSGSTENIYYIKFTFSGQQYVVISLEWNVQPASIVWAQGIITANPTSKFIVVTHRYLSAYGTLQTYGQTLWDNLVKLNDKIILVVSGDDNTGAFSSFLNAANNTGNNVPQVMVDHQSDVNNGNGYIMLVTILPEVAEMHTTEYSTNLGSYNGVEYHMNYGATDAYGTVTVHVAKSRRDTNKVLRLLQ